MGNEVYANGMEVACKAANGKSICAMPDVCLSPPSPPAGPVPIPYPNTGMASDATDGSKTVQISGQEAMLKDKSYFKQSTGDEAATKSLGMGVVTHQLQGKVYFTAWSMDVKFESENVVRHMDLTTHNHNPPPGNSPPWLYQDSMAMGDPTNPCKTTAAEVEKACTNKTYKNDTGGSCCKAKKCVLAPYGSQPECCEPPKRTKTKSANSMRKSTKISIRLRTQIKIENGHSERRRKKRPKHVQSILAATRTVLNIRLTNTIKTKT